MTDGSIASSRAANIAASSDCSSQETVDITTTNESMLGVDFFTPLTGQARAERVKQMSNKHPAFAKSRQSQEILVKIQQSLRRMPGVSANESAEIIEQLQQVGQIISQETSALVDALVKTQLDQEDTEKSVARMSLDNNLVKAEKDDLAQKANDLKSDLKVETQKKQEAEGEVKKVMDDLYNLTKDFRALREKSGKGEGSPDREGMIKVVEETIKLLEDQVNNRRSLWLMKHSDPQSVAKAIETLADSVSDNHAAHRSLMALKPTLNRQEERSESGDISRMINEFPAPRRPGSVFQPTHRPQSTAPPKMGQFHGRPPSAASNRRYASGWGGGGSGGGGGGGSNYMHNRQSSSAASMSSMSSFGRTSGRKALPSGSRYSPGGGGDNSWNYDERTAGAYARSNKDYYPHTPTGQGRNSRYGRNQENAPPSSGSEYALIRSSSVGPLIHMSEQFVSNWHDGIMEFYATTRQFVERHAVAPDDSLAQIVNPTPLWSILLATYYPLSEAEAGSYLDYHLRSESSKSCLMTRVIIDYIVNRVWVPAAWAGSDSNSTYALMDLERELEKMHGKPSALRQPLLDRQAAVVEEIIQHEHDGSFFRGKVDEITHTMLNNLKPLIDKRSTHAEAFNDMEQIAEQAWELSSKIMTSRLTFDFRFPEIGSRFSSQSMLPIWPQMDPMELQAKHWRVALVTTPVITCRNDTGANISAHSVALADVFCMQ